jgi:hypothetical protein
MITSKRKGSRLLATGIAASALATVAVGLWTAATAQAGDMEAKALLKAMSDYMAAQKTISLDYDTSFEIVTKDHQKLMLASSGAVNIDRPDKIRATRSGGFADVAMNFDGKTLTILGKDANLYAQAEVPGTIEQLIDALRDKFHKPVPGADLLISNAYDELMAEVTDVKDLGSGIIAGKECDHLAFRSKEVDWQIWIAQGERPYPCRYVITTKKVDQAPQYTVEVRNWKTGSDVAAVDFEFKNTTGATKIDPSKLGDMDIDEIPKVMMGAAQ